MREKQRRGEIKESWGDSVFVFLLWLEFRGVVSWERRGRGGIFLILGCLAG